MRSTRSIEIPAPSSITSITTDPGFQARLPWLPADEYGADLMPSPVNLVGERRAHTLPAPASGEQTDEVLREVLGMSADRLAELHESGVLGPPTTEKG